MPLATAIKNSNDKELAAIFEQFINKNNFHLSKTVTEISYKCFQASWNIQQLKIKSNGYGRTQPEAIKHALRNICDILIEYKSYSQYFYYRFNIKKTNTNQSYFLKQGQNQRPVTKLQTVLKTLPSKVDYSQTVKPVYYENLKQKQQKQNFNQVKKKYSRLLFKLNQILQENNKLREIINQKQQMNNAETTKQLKPITVCNSLEQTSKSSKVNIPKLKLSNIPNYHKKAGKSMNQDLMAVYNQKYGNAYSFE